MIRITYFFLVGLITFLWLLVRGIVSGKEIRWKREAKLLLVYICFIVVARFTFFPFSTVNGQIQPLIFDPVRVFPFRINWIPFINLLTYPTKGEILLNLIGNTAMFIPLGIVWPFVYKELNTHRKVIAAGFGFSLCIELLQLPFFDRVTDVDDLILNTAGFTIGYSIYLLVRKLRKR